MMDLNQFTSITSLFSQVVIVFFVYSRLKKQDKSDLGFLVALLLSVFGVNLLHLLFLAVGVSNFAFHLVVSCIGIGLGIEWIMNKRKLTDLKDSLHGGFAYIPILILMAIQLLVNFFKVESSIDGLLYHGPTLGNLISNQSIWKFDSINQYQYYSDLTMVGATTLAGVTRIVRLDDAAQVPYMLILAVSVSTILSLRVNNRFFRVAIAALILASPVIWLQPRILYVDLAYASSLTAAVALIIFLKTKELTYFLALGCAIGSVMSTKPSGIPISILLALFATYLLLKLKPSRAISMLLISLYLPIIIGLLFYVRNYVQFSNPLYPVAWNLGPLNFPGPIGVDAFTSRGGTEGGLVDFSRVFDFISNLLSGAKNGVTKLDYDPRTGGFSYSILLVPFLLGLSFINLLISGKSREDRNRLSKPLLVLVTSIVTILMLQPASTDSRYVIAPFALTICVFVLAMPRIPMQTTLAFGILLASAFSIVWVENNMYMGIKSVTPNLTTNLRSIFPGGQDPVLDSGNGFIWLQKESCVTVAIQSEGGVSGGGMKELTRQNTLSYGYFGNKLCNDLNVVIAPKDRNTNFDFEAKELAKISDLRFISVYTDELKEWETSLIKAGLISEEVAEVPGDADYPTEMTILKVN